jgi:hypothetical protein
MVAAKQEKARRLQMMLMRLASHYYRPDFTPAQAAARMDDMVRDLEEFYSCDVDAAITNYRRDAKSKGFPTSGVLRQLARDARFMREQPERAASSGNQRVKFEFGDSRPQMWWTQNRILWKPHWREDEIPAEWRENYFTIKAKREKAAAEERELARRAAELQAAAQETGNDEPF